MRPEVHWLLHFCLDKKLLTVQQVSGIVSNLPETTNAYACAKLLVSSGWVKDTAFLESALEAAVEKTENGFDPPDLTHGSSNQGSQNQTSDNQEAFPDFSKFEELSDEALFTAICRLFTHFQKVGASDVHITGGARPRIRKHRKIVYISDRILSDSLARRINYLLLSQEQRKRFETEHDLDYGLTLNNENDGFKMRFRANLMEQKKGISGVYRIVNDHLMSLEELGFPNTDTIRQLLHYHNGIILVTGPVGSGKTTTLATLVNELNQTRKDHIITLEDPIEVIQYSADSIITQREIGKHTKSFHSALKSALREDPDIIVIGEMRDLATIEMAVTAAETGHLVIATMHTRDAKSTLNRILDVFPPNQQNQIRAMTAGSLRGIICQRQLASADNGIVLACELMINTTAIANIIRDGKETGLENAMQSGKKFGMLTMNDSIKALLEQGKISPEVAAENSYNAEL